MRLVGTLIVLLSVILSFSSCLETAPTTPQVLKKTASKSNSSAEARIPASIFLNNVIYGDTNGCKTGLGISGKLTCGHPGAVSEVKWTFLGHENGRDIYHFQRKHPLDSDLETSESCKVQYYGKELVVFEDDIQSLTLFPAEVYN